MSKWRSELGRRFGIWAVEGSLRDFDGKTPPPGVFGVSHGNMPSADSLDRQDGALDLLAAAHGGVPHMRVPDEHVGGLRLTDLTRPLGRGDAVGTNRAVEGGVQGLPVGLRDAPRRSANSALPAALRGPPRHFAALRDAPQRSAALRVAE